MRFKIDWACLIVGSKFTIFVLFYFVFEGNFPSTYLEGRFDGWFFALPVWGLIFGEAYTWRGLFSEFYDMNINFSLIFNGVNKRVLIMQSSF